MAQNTGPDTSPQVFTDKAGGGGMTNSDMQGHRDSDKSKKCTATDEQGNSNY